MNIRTALPRRHTAHTLVWITLAALAVRAVLVPVESGDYRDFLHPWFEELRTYGGLAAVGRPVGNYMVTYIYILALLTHLPLPDLVTIKLVSVLGDVLLALVCRRFARSVTDSKRAADAAYAAALFLPSVVLNSAAWAQCDSLYTTALIACLLHLHEDRPARAMLAFSVGFVFKLQSVFLAPVLLAALVAKKVRFRHLLIVPAVYGLAVLPAFWAGRPLKELLLLYVGQAGTYRALSMNAPNWYAWLPAGCENAAVGAVGVLLAGALTLGAAMYAARRGNFLRGAPLIRFALFSLVWVPFLLPHMHERYFYPADLLTVLFVVCLPRERRVPLLVPLCSAALAVRFLCGAVWISPGALALPMLAAALFCAGALRRGAGGK